MDNINLTLEKTEPLVCEKCGSDTFKDVMKLRTVSKFITGGSEDGIIPIPLFACASCDHINERFLPKEMQVSNIV